MFTFITNFRNKVNAGLYAGRGGGGQGMHSAHTIPTEFKFDFKMAHSSLVLGTNTNIFGARRRTSSEAPIKFIFQGRTVKKHYTNSLAMFSCIKLKTAKFVGNSGP